MKFIGLYVSDRLFKEIERYRIKFGMSKGKILPRSEFIRMIIEEKIKRMKK